MFKQKSTIRVWRADLLMVLYSLAVSEKVRISQICVNRLRFENSIEDEKGKYTLNVCKKLCINETARRKYYCTTSHLLSLSLITSALFLDTYSGNHRKYK